MKKYIAILITVLLAATVLWNPVRAEKSETLFTMLMCYVLGGGTMADEICFTMPGSAKASMTGEIDAHVFNYCTLAEQLYATNGHHLTTCIWAPGGAESEADVHWYWENSYHSAPGGSKKERT